MAGSSRALQQCSAHELADRSASIADRRRPPSAETVFLRATRFSTLLERLLLLWGFFGFSDPFIVPSGIGSPSTEAQRAAISLSNAARVTARFSYASLVHSHDPPRLRHPASEDAEPTLVTKRDGLASVSVSDCDSTQ